jgi:four helix bundle protein
MIASSAFSLVTRRCLASRPRRSSWVAGRVTRIVFGFVAAIATTGPGTSSESASSSHGTSCCSQNASSFSSVANRGSGFLLGQGLRFIVPFSEYLSRQDSACAACQRGPACDRPDAGGGLLGDHHEKAAGARLAEVLPLHRLAGLHGEPLPPRGMADGADDLLYLGNAASPSVPADDVGSRCPIRPGPPWSRSSPRDVSATSRRRGEALRARRHASGDGRLPSLNQPLVEHPGSEDVPQTAHRDDGHPIGLAGDGQVVCRTLPVGESERAFAVPRVSWHRRVAYLASRRRRGQRTRASLSTVRNIAEGAGKTSADDKRRYYPSARGSATESARCSTCMRGSAAVPSGHQEGTPMLERMVAILVRLAKSFRARVTSSGSGSGKPGSLSDKFFMSRSSVRSACGRRAFLQTSHPSSPSTAPPPVAALPPLSTTVGSRSSSRYSVPVRCGDRRGPRKG